jgi:hypothetical protein
MGGAQPDALGMPPVGPPPGAMVAQDYDMQPIPGTVGGSNPVVTVLLIVLTCGIYGVYMLLKNKKS